MAQAEKQKVIRLYPDLQSVELMEELTQLLRDEKIDSMVILATKPYATEDEKEEKKGPGTIFRYWFARNGMGSLSVLGLVEYMKGLILKYIIDDIDLIRDEDYDG